MFQIKKAQEKIAELNVFIQQKCSNLSLELDFYGKFKNRENVSIYENMINPQIILCLNYDNSCISSIACKINKQNKTMEISSKTHESHEGKKYNTLLRSAIMLAASFIKYAADNSKTKRQRRQLNSILIHQNRIRQARMLPMTTLTRKSKNTKKSNTRKSKTTKMHNVTQIISRSINPISTLLLVKYFGATNAELQKYFDEQQIDTSTLTLDQVKEFQKEVDTNDMTSSEELEYMENNEDYGNPLLLVVNLLDPEVLKKIQNTFNSTLVKMICP
jgi:hypothetical protein